MIYLSPEIMSGLGEDTFWTWFKREFPSSSFKLPKKLSNEDMVLRYSTLGFLNIPSKSIALLWELYPEMKERLRSGQWDKVLLKIYESAKFCTYRTVASHLMVPFYEKFGTIDVLPIGVNTNLFKPMPQKDALREKYGIPPSKEVGIWCGTTHPMKGFSRLKDYARRHLDIHWIIVWKQESEAGYMEGAKNITKVPQNTLCELMNSADFYLACGELRPFYMVEWEAMACNLEMRVLDDVEKDFVPSNNPREDIFRLKWDRNSVKILWQDYLRRKGVTW